MTTASLAGDQSAEQRIESAITITATGSVGCVAPCVPECPHAGAHPWDLNPESEG